MSASPRPAQFVVVVDLVIAESEIANFMPLMAANAAASLAEEPGCHRFDICTDAQNPARIMLYEIYQDAAAFDLHLASGHYLSFDQATRHMLESKTVRRLTLKSD